MINYVCSEGWYRYFAAHLPDTGIVSDDLYIFPHIYLYIGHEHSGIAIRISNY
ncbi:hypothetical protein SAMN03003324_01247 [Pedobacter antarcticus]|uniref:Uncharacterized protein n=1 Tax=Pedobacter antarcticus TaxID=34086 RepID=A0A1I2CXL7_9SPHI|nr:hypothetical protein SAMN03003324_01247 [Pedobacter antarcticus]